MKKIFILITFTVLTIAAQAQVVLLDPEGKEYTDGQTMTIYSTIDPDWGDVVLKAPSVKNKGNQAVDVKLGVNIIALPAYTAVLQCFAINCFKYKQTGKYESDEVNVEAGEIKTTATEWQCYDSKADDFAKGTCTIEFTIYENGKKGNVVTVNYVNGDPASISSTNDAATVVKTYDLMGRETKTNKGIVLQQMNDGSIRKVLK